MKENVMKKAVLFCLSLIAALLLSGQIDAYAYTGSGTYDNPYMTADYYELQTLLNMKSTSATANGAYIKLSGYITATDANEDFVLMVSSGVKYLDLNGYSIQRNTASKKNQYLFEVCNQASLNILNSSAYRGSVITIYSTNTEQSTGLFYVDENASLHIGNVRKGQIKLEYEKMPSAATRPTIYVDGTFDCDSNVIVEGYVKSLYANSPYAVINIDGGEFESSIHIARASYVKITQCEIGPGLSGSNALIAPEGSLSSQSKVVQNGVTRTPQIIDGQYGTLIKIPANGMRTYIKTSLAPDIYSQPQNAIVFANGKNSAEFICAAKYVKSYKWIVCEHGSMTPISWSEISNHCSYSGETTNTLIITPNLDDTWMDGKTVYCILTGTTEETQNTILSNGASLIVSKPMITSLSVLDLDEPIVGQHPDTAITFSCPTTKAFSYYVRWVRFENGLGNTMASSDVFEEGCTYGAEILVDTKNGHQFASRIYVNPNTDDENVLFDGTLTVNGENPGAALVYNNGFSLKITAFWGKKPTSHTHTWTAYVGKKASMSEDGYLMKKCTCGKTMDMGDAGVIPKISKVTLSASSYAYDGTVKNPTVSITTSKGTTLSTSYYTVTKPSGRTNIGTYTYKITFKGRYTGSTSISFTIVPEQPKGVYLDSTYYQLNWDEVENRDGYYVYRSEDGGKNYNKIKTTSQTDYVDNDVVNGTTYKYKVIAYKKVDGVIYKSKASAIKTYYFLDKPVISSLLSINRGQIFLKWGRNTRATGYQIQYCLNKDFISGKKTVTITSNSTVSKTIKLLTSGKRYYVRIVSYKTVGNVKYYSKYSATKSITVR